MAKVDANGSAQFLGLNVQGTGSGIVNIGTAAAGYVGLIIKSVTSQTADLQQWQNSAGTVLGSVAATGQVNFMNYAYIDIYGQFVTPTTVYANNIQNNTGYYSFNNNGVGTITARTATNIPLTLKGAASQTANLQQWQSSSGTVLVSINADGSSNFNNIMQVKETWGGVALSVSALLGQSNPIQGWYTIDSNGDNKTEVAKIDINGQLAVKSVIGNTSSTISVNNY